MSAFCSYVVRFVDQRGESHEMTVLTNGGATKACVIATKQFTAANPKGPDIVEANVSLPQSLDRGSDGLPKIDPHALVDRWEW